VAYVTDLGADTEACRSVLRHRNSAAPSLYLTDPKRRAYTGLIRDQRNIPPKIRHRILPVLGLSAGHWNAPWPGGNEAADRRHL